MFKPYTHENGCVSIQISLSMGPVNNKLALVQVMARRWTGDKPVSEPMMALFTDAYMWHLVLMG